MIGPYRPPMLDKSDDHPALNVLRRRSQGAPIFASEPIQWHLESGVYDRTLCCGKKTDLVSTKKAGERECRRCVCCGALFALARSELPDFLSFCFDRRAQQVLPSAN